jgi:hypothetical protein
MPLMQVLKPLIHAASMAQFAEGFTGKLRYYPQKFTYWKTIDDYWGYPTRIYSDKPFAPHPLGALYNMIESYHRQLRKVTKVKSIFPNDESLLKMLYLATQDVLRKWTGRIQNWGEILLQLSIFFPDKVKSHLR